MRRLRTGSALGTIAVATIALPVATATASASFANYAITGLSPTFSIDVEVKV